MDVSEIKDATSDLTHVHFAFLGINADFTVNVPENVKAQWEKFAAGKFPFKKIISFGGWAESTEPATFQRYKDAVKPANRQTVAKNVIQFMDKYDIQGVDFDWE
jgi:chitinase